MKQARLVFMAMKNEGVVWTLKRIVFHVEGSWRRFNKKLLTIGYSRYLLPCGFNIVSYFGTPSKKHVPVVICLWNRLDRIPYIIKQLDKQKNQNIDVYFWNNNYIERGRVLKLLGDYTPRNSITSISLFNSRHNIGGIGRFYMIRKILNLKTCGPQVVMLDDDENITNHFIYDLLGHAAPNTYASSWAYSIGENYWHHRKNLNDGETANYCGTGGSIIDSSVFKNSTLFTKLPYKYWFIEDLWLSAYTKRLGWKLIKVNTPIEFVDLQGNQSLALATAKQQFYDYLNENVILLVDQG